MVFIVFTASPFEYAAEVQIGSTVRSNASCAEPGTDDGGEKLDPKCSFAMSMLRTFTLVPSGESALSD
jgi:hypothetical protein